MTEPNDPDLIALATPYALHAMPEAELADIERRVAAAPPDVAQAFADEVRAVRETMAVVSAATAVEPPHQLRDRLLTEVSSDPVRVLRRRIKRWQTIVLAAAAALVIGLGALGVGMAMRPTPSAVDRRAGVRRPRRADRVRRDSERRHGDGGVLPREERRRAGDEQRRAAASREPSTRCG